MVVSYTIVIYVAGGRVIPMGIAVESWGPFVYVDLLSILSRIDALEGKTDGGSINRTAVISRRCVERVANLFISCAHSRINLHRAWHPFVQNFGAAKGAEDRTKRGKAVGLVVQLISINIRPFDLQLVQQAGRRKTLSFSPVSRRPLLQIALSLCS